MPQIEVIATDGNVQKRILWIDIAPNGIYVGWCEKTRDIHISYHKDGKVFWTTNGKTQKIATFKPLKNFTGTHQICSFAFTSNLHKLRTPTYKMKKRRAIVYVDVRQYAAKKSYIGCNISLLEPGKLELLKPINKMPTKEIHILTQFRPWIVITIYEAKTEHPNNTK